MTGEHGTSVYAATYTKVSQELATKPHEYAQLARKAAAAEAAYKSTRAKRRLAAKANGEARSAADAEMVADADDEIGALYLERLVSEAEAEACKLAMFALRARLSFGQSLLGIEREADRVHATQTPTWDRR